jgi:hypothetical protein
MEYSDFIESISSAKLGGRGRGQDENGEVLDVAYGSADPVLSDKNIDEFLKQFRISGKGQPQSETGIVDIRKKDKKKPLKSGVVEIKHESHIVSVSDKKKPKPEVELEVEPELEPEPEVEKRAKTGDAEAFDNINGILSKYKKYVK